MKGLYRFSFLHLSFFIGALILSNMWVFVGLSFLAGFIPKLHINFFYYLLLAILAFAIALFINPIPEFINDSLGDIMKLNGISLWVVIGAVTVLTMSLLAKSANAIVLLISPLINSATSKKDDDDDDDYID
jgi:hypothetical protein